MDQALYMHLLSQQPMIKILLLPYLILRRHEAARGYRIWYKWRSVVWRRQWHPTPVLLPGKSHGPRSLVGCSPWGREESDTTEQLHFLFSLSCIGEGKGNPLQCSCLENPRDEGAWWAAVYGVTQSRTWLKWLSSSSSRLVMYGCECWTIKKAEHRRTDAFELWCWRRFLRVPWTARRSNLSVLPINIQDWFPLQWPGWISLQSKGLSRVFSNTTVQKHQFFCAQLSL